MPREGVLTQVDGWIVKHGEVRGFVYEGDGRDNRFVLNYLALLGVCDELMRHFPREDNPDGSEVFQEWIYDQGMDLRIPGLREALMTVPRGTERLVEATSSLLVVPTFVLDPLPPVGGKMAVGWDFTLNLDGGERMRLGKIGFERGFHAGVRDSVAERTRLGLAVYGASVFIDEINRGVGEVARAIDLPKPRLVKGVVGCLQFALIQQRAFYPHYRAFMEKLYG